MYAQTGGSYYLFYSSGYWAVGADYTGTMVQLRTSIPIDDTYCPEDVGRSWDYYSTLLQRWMSPVDNLGDPTQYVQVVQSSYQCFVGFRTKASLQTAVSMWAKDRAAALSSYGPISGWDVSAITDMSDLFTLLAEQELLSTGAYMDLEGMDLSGWDTSRVTDMSSMFKVRFPPAGAVHPAPTEPVPAYALRAPPPPPRSPSSRASV